MSTKDLVSQTYVYTVFYVVFAAFQGRVIEREAIVSQNALQVKQMFIRYLSHEIRTPLNTVLMGLQHLQEDFKKSGDCARRIETVEDAIESCEIAVKTLNNMLLYDKIETKLLALDTKPIHVMPFIDKTIQLFRAQAAHLKVTLSLRYASTNDDGTAVNWDELTLYGDVEKLGQVVRNVVSNALKFTPPEGNVVVELRKVSMEIASAASVAASSLSSSSDGIELRVTDTGAGISLENQAKLFHGIIQFTPGRLQDGEGSGLGLYIAKGIVDAHDGLITVSSEGEGRGSTFTVTLPLSKVPQPQQYIAADKPRSAMLRVFMAKKSDYNSSKKSSKVQSTLERLWNSQVLPVDRKKSYHHNNSSDVRAYKPLPPPAKSPLIRMRSDKTFAHSAEEEKASAKDHGEGEVGEGYYEIREESFRLSIFDHSMNDNDLAKSSKTTTTKKKKKPVILVVDDVASNRKMLNRLLQDRCEYSIDATNGLEAVSIIRDAMSQGLKFDIITMDYQMPVMDGPTATRQIREVGYTGLILGVTGNALVDDTNHFVACGANKVLIKPLNVQAFDRAVWELLPSLSLET